MKETIKHIKNPIENITSRIDLVEDTISDNGDKIFNLENEVEQTEKMLTSHG